MTNNSNYQIRNHPSLITTTLYQFTKKAAPHKRVVFEKMPTEFTSSSPLSSSREIINYQFSSHLLKQRNQAESLLQDATFFSRQRKCQKTKMKMQMLHLHSWKINSALLLWWILHWTMKKCILQPRITNLMMHQNRRFASSNPAFKISSALLKNPHPGIALSPFNDAQIQHFITKNASPIKKSHNIRCKSLPPGVWPHYRTITTLQHIHNGVRPPNPQCHLATPA